MSPNTSRIILGTAQFGLDYGIANTHGRMTDEEVKAVLKYACAHGIRGLDSAAAYGNSEETIGRALKSMNRNMDVVSKLPSSKEGDVQVREVVMRTLKRLGVKSMYGYLLHSFEDYRRTDAWKQLTALKEEGLISKIGFSLYHPQEAEQLIKDKVKFDLLQLPYSVFDRRFEVVLPILRQHKVELYARSIFLQGLAFLEPAKLPECLLGARAQINALRKISLKGGMTISALCLNFALINPHFHRVIIGVDTLEHLKTNLSDLRFFAKAKAVGEDFNMMVIEDENILLPYRWKL